MSVTATRPRAGNSAGRAALLSAALIGTGTVLGFARDLLIAHRFGASSSTDAFLVAWSIPESVSPLLIEDAMALAMVPAVTRALQQPHGVRPLVSLVLPRLALVLSLAAVAAVAAAPLLVDLLAPGIAAHGPAVTCVRLTAVTILTFGIAGFMNATLRAHHCFGPPAAIYLAYNLGILASITLLADGLGIVSAAAGVAAGGVLMILVQAPAFYRRLRARPHPDEAAPDATASASPDAPAGAPRLQPGTLATAALVPIVVYTLTRQGQVLVERFFASSLPAGAISHLNYAQKIAQVPMVLSLLLVTVTFPRLARASAHRDTAQIRHRVQTDLKAVSCVVLCAVAFLVAFAEPTVRFLFQHGHFDADDTARTADVLRIYALGLWGQAALGVLARVFFAQARPMWSPALAMAAGLGLTWTVAVLLAATAGTPALAAGNAAGITLTALLLLRQVGRRVVPIPLGRIGADLARAALAALAAGALAAAVAAVLAPSVFPLVKLAVGAVVLVTAFGLVLAAGDPSSRSMFARCCRAALRFRKARDSQARRV
ncbi:lipid II flippase MurJ [Actinomadura namibiensis]|uniref:Putative peptidoglycan lipid II flippase n=1 Tax=Actinomadura namibiensis TaxID=182080 RepID=A0A7W3QKT8_ACTNM|nr:lipid II flippase MurJ [Actinomadura namibiensis]MBA8950263.1 putative peptidoglycan lipid II flippase [Actinomadura namibiensis]